MQLLQEQEMEITKKPHKMNNNILISIITVNYKQSAVTNHLLASLQYISYPNIEIIVVDNCSGAADVKRINTRYPNVSLICNTKNLGFAGGNNVGIKACKGEMILLLNNDTTVGVGLIEPMLDLFSRFPEIGAVSPKIKYYHQPNTIQYAGFSKMNPFTLRMNTIGNKQPDDGLYDKVQETNFAHGCAMLVKREVINQVGLMPEAYFLYYEEHDWSSAIKRAGYKIYYQPKSVVFHKESVSVRKGSILKTYYLNRNRILYMRRNYELHYRIVACLYLLFVSVPKNILSYLWKRQYGHLRAYLNALAWNLSH